MTNASSTCEGPDRPRLADVIPITSARSAAPDLLEAQRRLIFERVAVEASALLERRAARRAARGLT